MWQTLHDAWWRLAQQDSPRSFFEALVCGLLRIGSIIYQVGVAVRNALYAYGLARVDQLPIPVVSVGNLTVGGAGKTPCVEWLAKKLLKLGKNPAILSRGYGARGRPYQLLSRERNLFINGRPLEASQKLADEPQLLSLHLPEVPVCVDPNRARAAKQLLAQESADILLLDDGFQHRRLGRSCDIVLIQADMPLAGWPLFPRGVMRERLQALGRAHIILINQTGCDVSTAKAWSESAQRINPQATVLITEHQPTCLVQAQTDQEKDLSWLQDKRVGLLCAIARPRSFEQTVTDLGAQVVWHQSYPDHYPYTDLEMRNLSRRLEQERVDALITTEKDWMRLSNFGKDYPRVFSFLIILRIQMRAVTGEGELDARLASLSAR